MKKIKIDQGMAQTIFAGLLIVALGVLGGCFLRIETTLIVSAISAIFLVSDIWDRSHGGGGSGKLGVIFMFAIPLMIFTAVLLVSGLICHWSDFMYLLSGVFS